MCVVGVVCVRVSFDVGVFVGYGISLGLGYECAWRGPVAFRYV
jgi:hypothetical protein